MDIGRIASSFKVAETVRKYPTANIVVTPHKAARPF
jgi:hypothetical protein